MAILLALVGACGGGETRLASSPPRPVTPVLRPPPPQARWFLPHEDEAVLAKIALGEGRTLYVGKDGRRELGDGTDAPISAPASRLDDLLGVLRDDARQFVFVNRRGETLRSSEPLGPLSAVTPGPLGPRDVTFRSLTTGKVAIMGTTTDGRVLRSVDFGRSWSPVDYAGSVKPYGHARAVGLDSTGNGVLLHIPQRLFVTHDDGATWRALPGGNAAIDVKRDGSDSVDVWEARGFGERLQGDALEPAKVWVPVYTRPKTTVPRRDGEKLLVGDRIVELETGLVPGKTDKTVLVRSARIGEPLSPPTSHPELVGASGSMSVVASYAEEVTSLASDPPAEGKAATSTLWKSRDYGATWVADAVLEGTMRSSNSLELAVGPRGFVYVGSLCATGGPCGHPQVRAAGKLRFEDVEFTQYFDPTAFVFDEAGEHVFALGRDGVIFESALDDNLFRRVKQLDGPSPPRGAALTIDSAGTLHALLYEDEDHAWSLRRLDRSGRALAVLYLPFDVQTVFAFAGDHGLAVEAVDRSQTSKPKGSASPPVGWETSDAGETWTRVDLVERFVERARCTPAGCLEGGRIRDGWGEAIVAGTTGGERIAATPEPPSAARATESHASSSDRRREITCRRAAPATALPALTDQTNNAQLFDAWHEGTRWAVLEGDPAERLSVVFGRDHSTSEVPLFASPEKASPDEVRSSVQALAHGYVALRARSGDRWAGRSPVALEFSWWSASTGRVSHGQLPHVPAFEASTSRNYIAGHVDIVDGGLFFQLPAQKSAFLLGEDGTRWPLTLPDDTPVTSAVRVGHRLMFGRHSLSSAADLVWSDDQGKSWKQRTWSLVDDTGSSNDEPTLSVVGDGVSIDVARRGEDFLAFVLKGEVPEDPPAPVVGVASTLGSTCDAHAGSRQFNVPLAADEGARIQLEGLGAGEAPASLVAWRRIARWSGAGRMCSSSYFFHGPGSSSGEAVLYPGDAFWTGWWFREKPGPKAKTTSPREAIPLTCDAPRSRS
jgi:hypothetical protein